jgi:omega-amidase
MPQIVAACFQWEVRPGRPDVNVARVEAALPLFSEKGCQLLLLPEMWSCGFDYGRLKELAETTPGILSHIQEWSRRYGMVIVGSLPEIEEGRIYNTNYVVDADGTVRGAYRKTHLFTLHGEHHHFAPGNQPLVSESRAGRLGVITCYDLRFPELARRLALDGAEILCVSAQWPLPRIEHWSLLLRCRAVENQMFVLGCNGCGSEGNLRYGGASAIVSPQGALLAQGNGGESRLLAQLDSQEMEAFRKHIPCFQDRRPDLYGMP